MLSAQRVAEWTKAVVAQKVQVFLPRFKLQMDMPLLLNDPLMKLGMKEAFDEDRADFTGMHTSDAKLYISHVLHKAFVEVNEEGTEAAATTGVVIKERVLAPREIVFRADRPFLFLIRENKTGGVLFLGRCANPQG